MAIRLMAALVALAVPQERPAAVLYVQCGEGVKWFAVDGRTGAVSPKGFLATPKQQPCYLRPSPDRRFLHAAAADRLLVFSIGADGALTKTAEAPSPGGPCYVDVHPTGRWAATANYGSGTTLIYPVGADGAVGELRSQSSGPQSHSARFHPSGRFLYALSVAGRRITRFDVDGKSPPLESALEGLGPRHIAFSSKGDAAFVVHERPIRVSSHRVDPETGRLTPVGDWAALEPGVAEKKELAAAEIAVAPSGRFVYASVRDFSKEANLNGIAVFSVDADSKALRLVEFVPSGGASPRGFVIDPTGTFLLAANEIPGTLRTFRMDAESGRLTPQGDLVQVGGRAIGIAWVDLAP